MPLRRRLASVAVIVPLLVPFVPRTVRAAPPYPDGLDVPVIVVSRNISLKPVEVARVMAAARLAGATPFPARYAVFPMTAYARGGETLMQQPKGWRIPMSARILPVDYVRITGGNEMADVLGSGQVLMGAASARIRGAQVVGAEEPRRDPRVREHETRAW